MAVHTDQRIINGILKNDRSTVAEVYKSCLPGIIRLIQTNSGSTDDARDVFQEALIAVFDKAKNSELVLTSSFNTFIYAICRNLWLKRLRKKGGDEVTLTENQVLTYETPMEMDWQDQHRKQLYRTYFEKLGEDCRRVLGLFFSGTKMEEIARKMGYASVAYAKKRKFKCKEKLTSQIMSDPLYAELKT